MYVISKKTKLNVTKHALTNKLLKVLHTYFIPTRPDFKIRIILEIGCLLGQNTFCMYVLQVS